MSPFIADHHAATSTGKLANSPSIALSYWHSWCYGIIQVRRQINTASNYRMLLEVICL